MGGILSRRQRSAGPGRANPAAQVGAARQRTDHRRRPPRVGRRCQCDGPGRRSRRPRRPPGWRRGRSRQWRARAPARDDWRSPPSGRPRPSGPGRGAGDATSAGSGSGSAAAGAVPWACGPYHPPWRAILTMIMVPTDRSVRSVERKRLTICLRVPPPLSTHKGRRGSVGVLMPETGDVTQELPKKPIPVRVPSHRRAVPGSHSPVLSHRRAVPGAQSPVLSHRRAVPSSQSPARSPRRTVPGSQSPVLSS